MERTAAIFAFLALASCSSTPAATNDGSSGSASSTPSAEGPSTSSSASTTPTNTAVATTTSAPTSSPTSRPTTVAKESGTGPKKPQDIDDVRAGAIQQVFAKLEAQAKTLKPHGACTSEKAWK